MPASTNASHMPRPIPLAAPVTTATLPWTSRMSRSSRLPIHHFPRPHLVLLQLDGAKQVQARKWMTGQAALAVAVAQEAVDAPLAHAVARIVGVREGEALEDPELGLDEVHTRGVVDVKTGGMRKGDRTSEKRETRG